MKRPLNVGIVGLGEVARVAQIIHLPILEMLREKYRIAAVCDISPSLLAIVGEQYGVDEVGRYLDYRLMVEQSDLDAVFVLNGNELHKDCTVAALRAGKHVF